MIGRAAQSRPWIFAEIDFYLQHGTRMAPPSIAEVQALLLRHLDEHYLHYGEPMGARTARKRIHFLARGLRGGEELCTRVNQTDDCTEQRRIFEEFLQQAAARSRFFEYIEAAVRVHEPELARQPSPDVKSEETRRRALQHA
jgi:tRNA-dihydrouridine synthase B